MAPGERGIGRGLAAILPEDGIGEPEFRQVPVELISPNADQPRRQLRTRLDRGTGEIDRRRRVSCSR